VPEGRMRGTPHPALRATLSPLCGARDLGVRGEISSRR
jgi:hypothetical protein